MKLLALIFLIFFFTNVHPQNEAEIPALIDSASVNQDSINISEIVIKQIEAARIKDSLNQIDESKKVESKEEVQIIDKASVLKPKVNKSYTFSLFEGVNSNIIILTSSAVLLGFIILLRRKKAEGKSKSSNTFKKNVQLIREEKVLKIDNKKSRAVRNKLLKNPLYIIKDEEAISKKAKDLNISKGELHLAARIKSYESNRRNK